MSQSMPVPADVPQQKSGSERLETMPPLFPQPQLVQLRHEAKPAQFKYVSRTTIHKQE